MVVRETTTSCLLGPCPPAPNPNHTYAPATDFRPCYDYPSAAPYSHTRDREHGSSQQADRYVRRVQAHANTGLEREEENRLAACGLRQRNHDARPPGARAPPACVRVVVPRAAHGAMRKATLPRPGRGRLGSGRG